jgi:hypothetical protein
MAIKITTDSIVKMFRPAAHQFNIDELNHEVDGWVEPLRIGPIWVMYKDKGKEALPLNQLATFFFDVPMYGTVLIVPPKQMPTEWGMVDSDDLKFSSEQVETGFLSSLQQALVYNRIFSKENQVWEMPKEDWIYQPNDTVDEYAIEFFNKSYSFIVEEERDGCILYEDDEVVVRTLTIEDKVKTYTQMIQHFVELEEYEKCAALQKLIDSIIAKA